MRARGACVSALQKPSTSGRGFFGVVGAVVDGAFGGAATVVVGVAVTTGCAATVVGTRVADFAGEATSA